MERRVLIVLAIVSLVVGVFAVGGVAGAAPDSGEVSEITRVVELPDVMSRSDLPVESLILRPDVASHHGFSTQGPPPRCDKDINTDVAISGVSFVAAQDNGICTNADIDVWQTTNASFVVQAGGDEAAFVITEVTDPANPTGTVFMWPGRLQRATFTPDVKAFVQGESQFIIVSLERVTQRGLCGIAIFDVTGFDVNGTAELRSQFVGSDWCDSHNVFVEGDSSGDGAFVYAVDDANRNMRVLDINSSGSVDAPVEIGSYTHPCVVNPDFDARCLDRPSPNAPIGFVTVLVHDMTVIDDRVYVAYWDAGTDIVDANALTVGCTGSDRCNITEALTAPFDIDPDGFLSHHAYPNAAGDRLIIQDEITFEAGFEPVQFFDISTVNDPLYLDGLTADQGFDGELIPAHNLLVIGSELYVGWYKAGLQIFDFDQLGFTGTGAAVAHHQVQTEGDDDSYSGAWAVRQLNIDGTDYVFTSDRNFGLIIDSRP